MTGEYHGRTKGLQMTSFGLHILAMAFMLCDHLWGTFLLPYDWLTGVGRLAFPIFAFLLAEGFHHTRDRKKYLLRLLAFAVITEIPFNLMMGRRVFYPIHQNVLWTFLLAVLLLSIYERAKRKGLVLRVLISLAATGVFCLLGFATFADYYGYGILIVALFYFTRRDVGNSVGKNSLLCVLQLLGMYWINCELMGGLVIPVSLFGHAFELPQQGLALLALPFIWLYRGKQGPYNRTIRNLYYWFYPVHMLVLWLVILYL